MAAMRRLRPNGPELKALSGLAWALDPARSSKLPDSALLDQKEANTLPRTLRAVHLFVESVRALSAGQIDQARIRIDAALDASESPCLSTRLGILAVTTRDEGRATKIAERLEQSDHLRQATSVRALQALSQGRFKHAQRLAAELGDGPEVVFVHAMIAYETWNLPAFEAALRQLKTADKDRREFAALAAAAGLMTRATDPNDKQLSRVAHSDIPWGELLAVDALLNGNQLEAAAKLVDRWPNEELRAPELSRVARLLRYQGRTQDALRATERALRFGEPTASLVIERVYSMLELDKRGQAHALLAQHGRVIPRGVSPWVGLLVDSYGAGGNDALIQEMSPPRDSEPLNVRILATRVLAKSKDPRAARQLAGLKLLAPEHPDVALASRSVE
jgi:tetratricopeptide (TPR) repeat protein